MTLGRSWLRLPRLLLVVLALAMAVSAVAAGATSTASFGVYTQSWQGISELRQLSAQQGAETTLVRDVSAYPSDGSGAVAIVLSPTSAYTPAERQRVASFVESGGTLVVAEDFRPHANPLLAAVGVESRFDGLPVRDGHSFEGSPAAPVATNLTDHPLTRQSDSLSLNHATVVKPGKNATVIARTSGYAYLDTNGNDTVDENETIGSYPVVVVEQVGAGRVILMSDPSLFINAMLDRAGNRAFAAAVTSSGDRVLYDTSHTAGRLPLLQRARFAIQDSPVLGFGIGGLAILGVWLWDRKPAPLTELVGEQEPAETPVSQDRLIEGVQARHPEWDSETIERVIDARRPDDRRPDSRRPATRRPDARRYDEHSEHEYDD